MDFLGEQYLYSFIIYYRFLYNFYISSNTAFASFRKSNGVHEIKLSILSELLQCDSDSPGGSFATHETLIVNTFRSGIGHLQLFTDFLIRID